MLQQVINRTVVRTRQAPEPCELCGAPLAGVHAHLLEERHKQLLCACRPCALLFERGGAGLGRFQLVPDRRIQLTGPPPADLGVPVGLAFFVPQPDGSVLAHYPSPAGATRGDLDAEIWANLVGQYEPLRSIRPEVEAFLVAAVRGLDERWLVPIDDCHRLVALVRGEWKGMSGGPELWARLPRFFAELSERGKGHGYPRGQA
ncbi:hypothetical protein Aph01nite_15570 [Acrocarpospora phusangensis]|uniref:Uncharacterized protein n=1 Tax=Acrocarpospora phusangensis TaxID=1070424 RepID=A0A919QBD9_9ACTN|nr:DUF5947 family protein [Acrocarpospora phusangensis]GIH23247.1 hypothetical protein Aph01nite_15570 [Acrocarpospora phusangensis]